MKSSLQRTPGINLSQQLSMPIIVPNLKTVFMSGWFISTQGNIVEGSLQVQEMNIYILMLRRFQNPNKPSVWSQDHFILISRTRKITSTTSIGHQTPSLQVNIDISSDTYSTTIQVPGYQKISNILQTGQTRHWIHLHIIIIKSFLVTINSKVGLSVHCII